MKTKYPFQILALLTLFIGLLPPQIITFAAPEIKGINVSIQASQLPVDYISQYSRAASQNCDCGPASVAMIVQAYGKRPAGLSPIDFIGDIRAKMNKSGSACPAVSAYTSNDDRIKALAAYGIKSTAINGNPLQSIKDALAQGKPVIARVNAKTLGRGNYTHAIVVIGFSSDGQTVLVNDPDNRFSNTATPGGANKSWAIAKFGEALVAAGSPYGLVISTALVSAPTYSAIWAAQSAYPTVLQGQSADFSVSFINISNAAWSNAGANPAHLGITNPDSGSVDYNYKSPFICPTWLGNMTPANLSETTVLPGGTGTFNFKICIPANTPPGKHRISVAPLIENITWMIQPGVTVYWDITVKEAEATCPSTFNGWKGEYYNSGNFSGPMTLCRDESEINFIWNMDSPASAVSPDNFSARFSRTLDLPEGEYTFHLTGDDGIRLMVDGQNLIDQWINQPATEYTAQIHLDAGSHSVQVDYYESTGGAIVKLWWDASTVQPASLSASASSTSPSIQIGETANVILNLNNISAEGLTAVEFACQTDPSLAEISALSESGLFGADAVFAPSGPTEGRFILPIAASNENKATDSGEAARFTIKALHSGELNVDCAVKVSNSDNELTDIPFTTVRISLNAIAIPPTEDPIIDEAPPATEIPSEEDGMLKGSVIASKPVTIRVLNADGSEAANIPAESNGSFVVSLSAGDYTIIASSDGFLSAQGNVVITAGQTSVMPQFTLLAGDINADNMIDALDIVSIGANYGKPVPSVADLNNDGKLDVLDLLLIAHNYRKSGPVNWQ
jgi:hypothetical protein